MALDKMVDSTKLDNALTATADAIRERGGHATGSESGTVVTVTDALAAPVVALSVAIEPVQAGSGDPSPNNVRPISGWNSVEVEATGANLLNDAYSASYTNEIVLTEGTYYAQAWVTQSPSQHTTNPALLINGAWTNITPPYSGDGISITDKSFGWLWADATQTITVSAGKTYTIRYNRNDAAMQTRRLTFSKTQLPAFSPYDGDHYTIQLGQTVYGGTLDVTSGKMVVDRAMVDLGTIPWSYSGSLFMTLAISGIKAPPDASTVPNCICEAYKAVAYGRLAATDPSFTIIYEGSSNVGRLWLKDTSFTDLASFKAFISGIHLCYELATPIEIPLTPTQIDTLAGTNNVWSNAGNITLKYLIDSELIPFDLENETGFADAIGSIIGVDDIIVIGDYGLCLNNFTVSGNICTSAAGTVSGNTLIAV